MYRAIKKLIIQQSDKSVPDKWESIRTNASLLIPTEIVKEKPKFHRRPYQISTLVASVCAFILISVFVLSKNFEFGYPAPNPEGTITPSTTTHPSQNAVQPSQDTLLPPQETTVPNRGQEMSIYINELTKEPEEQTLLFAILYDHIIPMSLEDLFTRYGLQFDVADVLDGMNLIEGGFLPWYNGYAIYQFPSGETFDQNVFHYRDTSKGQNLSIKLCSDAYPYGSIIEGQELTLSKIGGIEMTLAHYVSPEETKEIEEKNVFFGLFTASASDELNAANRDMYFAKFMYKGIGFFVSAEYMGEEDFLAILRYLVSS